MASDALETVNNKKLDDAAARAFYVERFDDFHLAWRIDDDSPSVKQFVEIAMEACA